jgi:uncharacterized protein YwbE
MIPQGVYITRDGKVYENYGTDVDGRLCTCGEHAGVCSDCDAHGEPLMWTRDLARLHVYPPEFVTKRDEATGKVICACVLCMCVYVEIVTKREEATGKVICACVLCMCVYVEIVTKRDEATGRVICACVLGVCVYVEIVTKRDEATGRVMCVCVCVFVYLCVCVWRL